MIKELIIIFESNSLLYVFFYWSAFFFRFVSLRLNVPVNNFSVMLGRSYRFLGITSTFESKCILFNDTTRSDPSGARTPTSESGVPEALTTRPPRPLGRHFLFIMINAPQKTRKSNETSVNVPISKGERWIIVNA